jgi:hypothetical protein
MNFGLIKYMCWGIWKIGPVPTDSVVMPDGQVQEVRGGDKERGEGRRPV